MRFSSFLSIRRIQTFAAVTAVAATAALPLQAQADCGAAAASTAAASAALVETARANVDGLSGLMLCMWPLMDREAFRAAMVDASAQIDEDALAMLVIELGSNLMLNAEVQIVPDATITEPPASAS